MIHMNSIKNTLVYILFVFGQTTFAETIQLIFIRHAEAEHNILIEQKKQAEARELHDPKLTERGFSQANALAESLINQKIDIVITSPLTRALQTVEATFKHRKIPIVVSSQLAEHGYGPWPCDFGSDINILRNRFPNLDFSFLPDTWGQRETKRHYEERVRNFATMLQMHSKLYGTEKHIAIVTHGGFLKDLLRQFGKIDISFGNCEFREYTWDLDENRIIN
jgi:broad specificity phosphatase PhoE